MSSVMQEFTTGLWKDLPPFRLVTNSSSPVAPLMC